MLPVRGVRSDVEEGWRGSSRSSRSAGWLCQYQSFPWIADVGDGKRVELCCVPSSGSIRRSCSILVSAIVNIHSCGCSRGYCEEDVCDGARAGAGVADSLQPTRDAPLGGRLLCGAGSVSNHLTTFHLKLTSTGAVTSEHLTLHERVSSGGTLCFLRHWSLSHAQKLSTID
jgi:hypothetical protein